MGSGVSVSVKKYIAKCLGIVCLEIIILFVVNLYVIARMNDADGRLYRVEAARIEKRLLAGEKCEDISLKEYPHITEIGEFHASQKINDDYLVVASGDALYYMGYKGNGKSYDMLVILDIMAGAVILISLCVFLYVAQTVIKPFSRMKEMPYELSKGHLVMPVKAEKNKVFGKFLWGMDLLRENLEDSKAEELRLQKEKKTLLLSISHDIKTPLSSIKLYGKALNDNLYTDEEKKKEVYQGILRNADDIERYVNEIIKASKEDFLNLTVKAGNAYLEDVLTYIDDYYRDKLEPKNIEWSIEPYENCLLSTDRERLIEVLQNIVENAIKYGDGEYIRVSVEEEEGCKLISVRSSGEPIKEEELPHLFDSFYRGSNVNNKKGSGLGLYICRTLMRMMDGEVYAKTYDAANEFTVVVRKA